MSSISASAENLTPEGQQYDGSSNMCLELALEGERLCKGGDCRAGVAFFQAAIQAGTDDLRTLSAIYSQLGNAYFYLGDYSKAMQYHKHDLTLARTMGDRLGEAKSSGNLGNTLKVMGRFDEAVVCCKRHLELSRELEDRQSEGRALYNLGNVYHAKGKHVGRVGQKDPGEFSEQVKECLHQAVAYYDAILTLKQISSVFRRENLELMREINDVAAQGRACGNLGNTHYLLGDFGQSIKYHEERLSIARQFGDKAAERRAHSNLGNSHIFLGQFEDAAHHYKRTLALAQELGDRAVEAQACYSLGNTYTLLREYETAVEYHLRHLLIAQHLCDKVGEGRACWSLGNAYAALGNHEKALYYANEHYKISRELGDTVGESTAKLNILDLRKAMDLPESSPDSLEGSANRNEEINSQRNGIVDSSEQQERNQRVRRESMERLSLIKMTPDGKQQVQKVQKLPSLSTIPSGSTRNEEDDSFFDLLSRFQSKRMDDQRCSLNVDNKENRNVVNLPKSSESPDELLDMIAGMQSKRMDEQRATLPYLPGLQSTSSLHRFSEANSCNNAIPDDTFLDQLVRCQSSRLEDQRSPMPAAAVDAEAEDPLPPSASASAATKKSGATVPDEDFFSLIMRFQSSGRMEDQRAAIPRVESRIANGNVPHAQNGPTTTTSNSSNSSKKKNK